MQNERCVAVVCVDTEGCRSRGSETLEAEGQRTPADLSEPLSAVLKLETPNQNPAGHEQGSPHRGKRARHHLRTEPKSHFIKQTGRHANKKKKPH